MSDPKESVVNKYGQFTIVPNRLIEIAHIIGLDALVIWTILQYHAGQSDSAFPSYDRLQAMTGLTRARVSAAIKVLTKFGLVVKHKRFSQSTVYELQLLTKEMVESILSQAEPQNTSSSGGELVDESPVVQGVDSSSSTGELPVVQQVDANKTQLTRLIEQDSNMAAKTAAVSDPPESEFPEIVKNPRALKALQDFEKNRQEATANGGGLDLSQWPEDCRPWVKKFCDLWQIEPPRPTGKKGGDFGLWIQESRYLAEAAGEFGTMVLERVYSDHESERKEKGKAPFMVSRPGSLIKAARAKAGELRRAGVVPGPGQPDPRQESLEDYLARVAEQKAANERYMAEVRAKRDEMVKQGVGVYGGAK